MPKVRERGGRSGELKHTARSQPECRRPSFPTLIEFVFSLLLYSRNITPHIQKQHRQSHNFHVRQGDRLGRAATPSPAARIQPRSIPKAKPVRAWDCFRPVGPVPPDSLRLSMLRYLSLGRPVGI
jgi:hypothetical protein